MSGDIVNLRRARKARARAGQAAEGATNRATYGRPLHEREAAILATSLADRRLDGHRRGDPDPPVREASDRDAPFGPGDGDAA